jgi:1-deoxy-D-xylulose-5-phosphate reductoisomerase
MKSLLVLGSTGSIGTQTLDVVRASGGRFGVVGLAAGRAWKPIVEQALEFRPRAVALCDEGAAEAARERLPGSIAVLSGPDALQELAAESEYDQAVHGVVGAQGLAASVEVLARGRELALANKESLVIAGAELMELAARSGGTILPVDSEICALHQCLRGEGGRSGPSGNGLAPDATARVRKVVLTASGGALRDLPIDALEDATPEQALQHPNWAMGPRITVGSATLMNKALEVVEVHHYLGLPSERIAVVLHRQSVVHSLVEFIDGSVLAQMGPPDMRGPLHYCLNFPDRAPAALSGFDARLYARLTFEEVDAGRFPALELGYRCVEEGGDSGCVLNAADEVATEAFLAHRIRFGDMHRIQSRVLDRRSGLHGSVERLLESDRRARSLARDEIAALCPS